MPEPDLDPIERKTVLVVDDTPDNLALISGLLKDHYRVKVANSGDKALRIARGDEPPDLILLDIMMPGHSGYDVCRELMSDRATRDIPIVFLTSMTAEEDEKRGLDLGAVDYITKPISPPILLARVRTHLQNKAASDFLRDQNDYLESEVARRTRELTAIQDVTIHALASLAETRDTDTGNHIRRTQCYLRAVAEKLKEHPRFRHFLDDATIEMLYKSAPLHDIGKVGIPDRILLKPARLDEGEYEIMKTHTTLGRDALQHAEDRLGMKVDFLRYAKQIALSHQERWDGGGYPEGLGGDDIPIPARLMAVADVYDALVSKRVYKPGMSHDEALLILAEGRGTHFDPDIVDAFLEIGDEIRRIATLFRDSEEELAEKRESLERIARQSGVDGRPR